MWSNTPVYVAGLDRGVRPIGPWSTCTTLSRCCMPVTRVCLPGTIRVPCSSLASALYRMSLTSVDLPDPETPVTATSKPSGNATSTPRRLCSAAPLTTTSRVLDRFRRACGTAITSRPVRYAPEAVQDRSEEHTSELQSPDHLVCRLLLEKKKKIA